MFWWVVLALLAFAVPTYGQVGSGSYAGLPFLRLGANFRPDAEWQSLRLGPVQAVAEALVFPAYDTNSALRGWYRTRGELPVRVVTVGMLDPSPGEARRLNVIRPEFRTDTGPGQAPVWVFAAGESSADALYRFDANGLSRVVPPGATLPFAEGRTVSVYGAPQHAGGEIAVTASGSRTAGGRDWTGVYRVVGENLVRVADSGTTLPGAVGTPDGWGVSVGFDGSTVAFVASRGTPVVARGLFRQTSDGGLALLLGTGDVLPGGEVVTGIEDGPVVQAGAVHALVRLGGTTNALVRFASGSGTVSVVARDGDLDPDGVAITEVGMRGWAVDGERLAFGAKSGGYAGVYVMQNGQWETVMTQGHFVDPEATILSIFERVSVDDLKGTTLALRWQLGPDVSSNFEVMATLAKPSVPVIVARPKNVSVPLGGRMEFTVTALGDPPLHALWTGDGYSAAVDQYPTFVIEPATAADTKEYWVLVTNQFGSSGILMGIQGNVETGPVLTKSPQDTTVDSGTGSLFLRWDAVGGLPMREQWYHDGQPVPQGGVARAFYRGRVTASEAGRYWAVVSNAWGSVTTSVATVTVRLSAPNPEFAGRRFRSFEMLVSDAAEVRWWEGRLAFAEYGSAPWSTGFERLLARLPGSYPDLLPAGVPLPPGRGPLNAARVIPASGDGDPLYFFGGDVSFLGLYRLEGSTVVPLVDVLTPVPEAASEHFGAFPGLAAQAGSRVAFVGTTEQRVGVYAWGEGALRRLLDTRMDLGLPGLAGASVEGIGYDGETAAVLVRNLATHLTVVIEVPPSGTPRVLAAVGRPYGGAVQFEGDISDLDAPVVADGAVYLQGTVPGRGRNIMRWKNGVGTSFASSVSSTDLGRIRRIVSERLVVDGGRVYFTAIVAGATGDQLAMLVADGSSVKSVFGSTDIDQRRVLDLEVIDVAGDRVAIAIEKQDTPGFRWAYVNDGTPTPPAQAVAFERSGRDTLRVVVPTGMYLETTRSLDLPWEYVPATNAVVTSTTEQARFYRLRWP